LPSAAGEAERVWSGGVKDTASLAVLEDFVRRYPDTIFATMARVRLEELRKQQAAPAAPARQPALPPAAVVAPQDAATESARTESEDIIARIRPIKEKGGTHEWDVVVRKIMLAKYDLNASGKIDTPAEVDRIDCAVWSMLNQQIISAGQYPSGLLGTYFNVNNHIWNGGDLGFDIGVREHVHKRTKICGLNY
jgi:hypothetical protein